MSAFSSLPIRRLTVDEVARMVQAGILGEDEPVELLDGVLVSMSPQGPRHASRVAILAERLGELFADGFCVRQEKPLAVDVSSLPEPDIAVVRGNHADYELRHPAGIDCALVVELAVTSLETDLDKASLYARAGVPAYLLVDLTGRRVLVHEGPRDGRYAPAIEVGEGGSVRVPGTEAVWPVSSLLPVED